MENNRRQHKITYWKTLLTLTNFKRDGQKFCSFNFSQPHTCSSLFNLSASNLLREVSPLLRVQRTQASCY